MKKNVLIIAEAGINHNGDINLAKKLIDAAKEAGADIIKFQTFISEKVVSRYAPKAEYQRKNTKNIGNQLDMVRKLELSFSEFSELNDYCDNIGIEFLSTAFDLESIEFLESLNMQRWKIPSGDITNLPYLIKISKLGKPIILSTGMSTMAEIKNAVAILGANHSINLTILHCTTEYPAPYKDINLNAMRSIKTEFKVDVGYSDHSNGIEVSIAAVALGATVIEKHFTLDRNMDGPDHKASLEPNELKRMIKSIRNIEDALGSYDKIVSNSEKKNIAVARKSIVAKCDIKKGALFTKENLDIKRPGTGINPMNWFEILGQKALRDFKEDELIEL